ncbi:MAG: 23S rRNA pseudouridine(2605) synthase RluB [Alteromonadaceae bacterium]|nr:23S rRNA pseudouridine(2605) synthase RluB [Alteromonadaceae bacterium]
MSRQGKPVSRAPRSTPQNPAQASQSQRQPPERLQKVLARAGLGSRRELEALIEAGRIAINGVAADLGAKLAPGDTVEIDGKPVSLDGIFESERRVLIYNKPEGEVTTRQDPEGRPTVFDRLPKLKSQRWISVGRLDINTTGLLLFTTDGELANRLMHPSHQVDREYAVRVFGEVDEAMQQRLVEGVLLDDGMAAFSDLAPAGGSGLNRWFHVTLLEGRNREVRRLWESQGVKVSRLKRVRFGPILLPSRVSLGRWEELDQKTVDGLSAQVGLEPKALPVKAPDEKARFERQKGKAAPAAKARASARRKKPDERDADDAPRRVSRDQLATKAPRKRRAPKPSRRQS